jgi:hypothetical protein
VVAVGVALTGLGLLAFVLVMVLAAPIDVALMRSGRLRDERNAHEKLPHAAA